jgi:hypothetical protein
VTSKVPQESLFLVHEILYKFTYKKLELFFKNEYLSYLYRYFYTNWAEEVLDEMDDKKKDYMLGMHFIYRVFVN